MSQAATIIIADDHPLFRGALKQALTQSAGGTEIVEAGDFEEARKAARMHGEADLMLLDLTMPGGSGLTGLMMIRAEFQNIPVAVITASDDQATIRRAIELGASAFIPKSSGIEEIRTAISTVLEGGLWFPPGFDAGREHDPEIETLIGRLKTLTPQQTRVLGMIGEGLLNKQIAYELGVSEATIKAHVSAILLKLDVDSRTQAVIQMAKIGTAISA
ncbi:response regulator transcription factor [Rhizobium sp. KVB221]|uniref:Response regulator transcription factor n=1 Tax=Rhizobium setariae TaxID=2801340 RepID=A0A936YSH6_9HYPH|nr:response regulator transcription factor [Rhizobium setariae]MBL0371847.1 response regulator transcription factor [Rhizobium setariae]